ncbi:MAG: KpsF/GutQ family sugar-phosphate isomerase [Sphingobacteriales bacterium]|nr:KpsF/GutQ family sugar-phosphate isomerase [Sphingobacteriales bacterium]
MKSELIIPVALKTLELQAESISNLAAYINADFVKAVETIAYGKGRFVVSGIGKSAIIAQKIVATLNSTGTASLFMHAADAIHGDLGMIQSEDIVMVISKSGESSEIKVLLPLLKSFGNVLIGMAGNSQSFLATHCDLLLNTTVLQEACPNNLAPTTSTTAQMVMGDALAVCLMELKGFNREDFARFHPGGALGKKLYLRVGDLLQQNQQPKVAPGAGIPEVIVEITRNRLGAAAVIGEEDTIEGIITDGDLRRMLEKNDYESSYTAAAIMGKNPKSIEKDALAAEAFSQMRNYHINQLIVTENGKYAGIIHIQDLIREGII